MNLGEFIYPNLHQNEYLNELHMQVLFAYSNFTFGENYSLEKINLNDVLRFTDLLSKSVDKDCCDKHKNISQELISLLLVLCPNDGRVEHVAGSVLSNIHNLRGLSLKSPHYESLDWRERIYDGCMKENLKVPNEENLFYFKSQKDVLDNFKRNYFSYSGPTSMGKSFIIRSFIKNNIFEGKKENYVIVVPTKALVNEISSKLIKELKESLIKNDYKILTSPGSLALERKHNFILVFTPERLSYLLLNKPNFRIDYLFVDEAQKISSKDGRSPFYYKLIDTITRNNTDTRIFFSSPNLPNPDVYLKLIQVSDQPVGTSEAYRFTPVNQIKFLVNLNSNEYFIYNDLSDKFEEMNLFSNKKISNLTTLIKHVGNKKKNIIYCSSTRKAVSLAVDYASVLTNKVIDERLQKLIKEISNEIHVDYYLLEVLQKGVAYHIGYLPSNIREEIEILYKDGVLKTIFCTSTLIEGVNLPADNLFITNYKNGSSNLTPIEFKNLVGRVGRIEYNLYGNVFLTVLDTSTKPEKFVELVEKEIKEQSLSIISELKPKYKKYIVEQLVKGNISLEKQTSQTENEYKLMRKFAIILLRDILTNNNSYVKSQFSDFLDQTTIGKIKEAFSDKENIDDDITVSVDQMDNLESAIKGGLSYPGFEYDELIDFLQKLHKIFKWEKYEQGTIGNCKSLNYYAVILIQWVQGYGLGQIVSKAIEYKQKNSGQIRNAQYELVFYNDSKEHRNIVITDTLNVIEQVILFQISNYFLKFSLQYKKIHSSASIQNDWYEYVEYGTNNPITIFLQKQEISRETATYIKRSDYLIEVNNEWKLKESILKCGKASVENELSQVKFNMPELFV